MRDEHRQHAPAFPSHCEVHGCHERPQEWFETGGLTFDVCLTHGLQLRAGEAFTATSEEVFLGSEAASDLLSTRALPTATGTVLTLVLGHHGVADQEVPISITPQTRKTLLRILRPDHAGASADGEGGGGVEADGEEHRSGSSWSSESHDRRRR